MQVVSFIVIFVVLFICSRISFVCFLNDFTKDGWQFIMNERRRRRSHKGGGAANILSPSPRNEIRRHLVLVFSLVGCL